MKYSLSDIIKDLLAKIPVLENRINTLSTKITVLSQNADTGKWGQLYWIDHTENYYRTLQLAIKYDGEEYILHNLSSWTIPTVNIVVQGNMGNSLGGSGGKVQIGEQHFGYDNKWLSTAYIEAYLRNTYMPEHNMEKVYYSGVITSPLDGVSTTDISGIVEA